MQLPDEIRTFVRASTGNYGKVKLVLQRNKFFVESAFPDVLARLLKARAPGQLIPCHPLARRGTAPLPASPPRSAAYAAPGAAAQAALERVHVQCGGMRAAAQKRSREARGQGLQAGPAGPHHLVGRWGGRWGGLDPVILSSGLHRGVPGGRAGPHHPAGARDGG